MAAELVIPPKLAEAAVRWEGDAGRRWLERLPALVVEVAEQWDLDVAPPLEPGGNISWVAPVRRRSDDLDAVLKLQLPHPESDPEATGLRTWDGNGAVRLYEHDAARHALLIERCDPGRALVDEQGTDAAVTAGAELGARLHAVDVPADVPTLASVLDLWADELDARLARPYVDAGVARLVLDTLRTRPRSCRDNVLLHGDLNPTNVLSAQRSPWLTIDPKPMVGDPAYDGPRLVTQPDPLLADDPGGVLDRRLDIVSDSMGIDRDALVLWCLVGAVEMGASARSHGDDVTSVSLCRHVDLLTARLP